MNEHLAISLFRVDSTSNYLDLIFNVDSGYTFWGLQIEVKYLNNKEWASQFFDLTNAIIGDEPVKHHYAVRIPLSKLGLNNVPAMYLATFKIHEGEPNSESEPEPYSEVPDAICSDVNSVYYELLSGLLTEEKCEEVSDDIIRNYLILYGHLAAMIQKDIETAMEYFKLIINKFSKCGDKSNSPCGCGCNGKQKVKHSCGCGR